MDAISKIEGKDLNKQQKLEFYLIFSFNVLLYLFLIVLIIFVVASEHNQFWLISRSFKASIEVASGLGIVISGLKLLLTIKRMMGSVPKNLLFWITIGAITSIIKSGEQIFFYFSDQDDTFQLFNMIILFISYHLTDLIPTLVFLHSFKVYSRFLRQNRESIDSFDEIISEKLQTFDLD
jgi:threonine/homoserine/homoserine lactone efflux protein